MEITEVRVKLMDDPHDRLQAFCSITFDACFVVRDLKIIQGTKGSFVAMPSRKLTDRCRRCGNKNHLRCTYCSQCGQKLDQDRAIKGEDGRAKLYADIAHPINSRCREHIQRHVLQAYEEELLRAQQPGYVCTYDDYGENDYDSEQECASTAGATNGQATWQGPDETSHRIEPAAETPSRPHHGLPHPREARVTAQAGHEHAVRDGEHFGEGLV